MLTKAQILNNVNELKEFRGSYIYKCRRNYRAYNATKNASLTYLKNPTTVGLDYFGSEDEVDTTSDPRLNVIASCTDTLVSKVSNLKVRPFVNTVNGSYSDMKLARQIQQFFDIYYDYQEINKKARKVFLDSCIFDTGVMYVNEETKEIKRVAPFQVFYRQSEEFYNNLTRIYYEQKDYPTTLLDESFKIKKDVEYVDYGVYYDTFNKVKAYIINGVVAKTETYDKAVVPFVIIHYKDPVVGGTNLSLVDALYDIQEEINVLNKRIKDASQLNIAQTFFVPNTSELKVSQVNNRVGNVVSYTPMEGISQPISGFTPPIIDSQYQVLLDSYIQKAYEIAGVSQLSAMSHKPSGLNSGIALSTYEDVESDRFQTQVDSMIRIYMNVASVCKEVFDGDILPEDRRQLPLEWSRVRECLSKYKLQFSAAESLSKDPSQKLQQLQQLATAGIIPASRVASLMELPDIEQGYSISTNALDAVMNVIDGCLEEDNYEVPDYIPFPLLKEEIINCQLSLKAANKEHKNDEDINKLIKLYQIVENKEQEFTSAAEAQQADLANNAGSEQLGNVGNVLEQEANITRRPESDNAGWVDSKDYQKF